MNAQVFSQRRERYMQQASGVTVLFASPHASRNSDVHYEYRPDADFYYLTGFSEPEAVAVLNPANPEKRFVLFVRPRDPAREVWDGLRAGVDGARERFGADEAHPIEKVAEELPKLLENQKVLFHRLGRQPGDDSAVMQALGKVKANRAVHAWPTTMRDPADVLAELRLIKQVEDISWMRKAAEITAEAHREAMRAAAPGRWEYEVEAVVEFVFRRRGAEGWGYPSIVGSGPNTCILHYNENNRQMQDGEMLLVDAGAEVELYTGDVTRSFPVNGRFTPEQRAIYGLCLDAQKAAIAAAVPGSKFGAPHERALDVIARGLIDLGLIEGPLEHALEKELYKPFFMHKTSHWLGMDVHDAGRYRDESGEPRVLAPGMVLTIEPGIYVGSSAPVDPKWHDIGVRIEDDLLITETGHEILTAAAPKEIGEVERICAEKCRYLGE